MKTNAAFYSLVLLMLIAILSCASAEAKEIKQRTLKAYDRRRKSKRRSENRMNDWLTGSGEFDYSNKDEPELPLFDQGPQYNAPGPRQYAPAPKQYEQPYQAPAPPNNNQPQMNQQQQWNPQNIQQPQFQSSQERRFPQKEPPPPQFNANSNPQFQQNNNQRNPNDFGSQNSGNHLNEPHREIQGPQRGFEQNMPSNMRNPEYQQQPQQQQFPFPPQQEVVQEESWQPKVDDNQLNAWLREGEPPAPTFSPEDERFRQQRLSQMKDKFTLHDEERRKEEGLRNTEGQVMIGKTHLQREELEGNGRRIPNQVEVLAGNQMFIPPPPPPPPFAPQPAIQPPPDMQFYKPPDYYKGKINPNEGSKILTETYGMQHQQVLQPEGRNPEIHRQWNERGRNENQKGRSHALDDPPAEIIDRVRWFDDDYDYSKSSRVNLPSKNVLLSLPGVIMLHRYSSKYFYE